MTPQEPEDRPTSKAPPRSTQPHADGAKRAPEMAEFIVGIGASAGGLGALRELMAALSPHTGAGFVVLQHLSPEAPSLTPELLAKHTSMPLRHAESDSVVGADEVVFLPPGATLRIRNGRLRLERGREPGSPPAVIDVFLRSLAEDRGTDAAAILLSGSGSDGTLGLQAVREHGGLTMVQDPQTAEFDGMPLSAVRAGVADYVEPVAELAAILADLLSRRRETPPEAEPFQLSETALGRVTSVLRKHTGHDFRGYKSGTVGRRLRRRVQLRGSASLEEYIGTLEGEAEEAKALFRDLMIGVTEFFRDPAMWRELSERVLPKLAAERDGEDIRVWAVGCATGEEAYSLAILLEECLAQVANPPGAKIFATDIDEQGLAFAREGLYPDGITQHVSRPRLERFFIRENDHYRVVKRIRERCIFAPHNLLQDPPFSRLDLISCRNLLIYLKPTAQEHATAVFQYALRPGGHLVLGAAETLASHRELFDMVSQDATIFRRNEQPGDTPSSLLEGTFGADRVARRMTLELPARTRPKPQNVRRAVEQLLLQQYGPAAILIDKRREVLQYFGRTRRYIEPSAAEGRGTVLDMVLPDLQRPLRLALREAERERREVVRDGVRVDTDGRPETVDIRVRPAAEIEPDSDLLLVVFQGRSAEPPVELAAAHESEPSTLQQEVEEELRDTRERLQATIEQLQSANEELQSANEELISMNEELQTSKEESLSINEELNTVNRELESKLSELRRANDDLQNLFRSTEIATVFLDKKLRIKRFTPTVTALFRLREADVGRPIDDMAHRFEDGDLEEEIDRVLRTHVPRQVEVQTPKDGRWYTLRISPYRTLDDVIDGVVLTFTDISDIKRTEQRLRAERRYAESIVESVHDPLLVLGADLSILSASRSFYWAFETTPEEAGGRPLLEVVGERWDRALVERGLRRVLSEGEPLRALEVELDASDGRRRILRLDARPLRIEGSDTERVLVALPDITELKERERRRESEARRKDWFLAMLGHELRNPLAPIRNTVHLLQRKELDDAQRRRMFEILERQLAHLTRLVDDMLDISRITEGKLPLATERLDLVRLLHEVVEDHRQRLEEKGLRLEVALPDRPAFTVGDAARLSQALGNLVDNARKYTESGGTVRLQLEVVEGGSEAEIVVADTGAGMASDLLDHAFEAFQQGPRGPEHSEQGLGVGLTLVRTVAMAHGGSVRAESAGPGQGSAFILQLPLRADEPPGRETSGQEASGQQASGQEASGTAIPRAEARAGRGVGEEASASGSEPRRILIVEDREETGETTRLLLELDGHLVRTVASGREGVEAARDFRPHVLFCDLGLPGGMSGYDVARAIRSDPALGSIYLCALTGYGQESDRTAAREAGFDAFLVKPVAADDLHQALRDGRRA